MIIRATEPQRQSPDGITTVSVLGVPVSDLDLDGIIDRLGYWRLTDQRHYVCLASAHGVTASQTDAALLEAYERAGVVAPDGKPIALLARLQSSVVRQVRGTDLLLRACREPGWRHYFYGTTSETLGRLERSLAVKAPRATVVGGCAPPFRELNDDELSAICESINAAAPDIIWVGLSTPKQEAWMVRTREMLNATAIVGVGAAFDFVAGVKREAPAIFTATGLEWLYRMAQEPLRLGPRYLKVNPALVRAVMQQYYARKTPA